MHINNFINPLNSITISNKQEAAISAAAQNAEKKLSKKQDRLDASNKGEVVKKITDKKDLQYIYPEDCTTLSERKKFRAKTRKAVERLLKTYKKVKEGKGPEGVTLEAARKEANRFFKTVHTQPELITE